MPQIHSKSEMIAKLQKFNSVYKKYWIKKVYLCGSYSRWDQHKWSDVDIYVQTEKELNYIDYMKFKFTMEDKLKSTVDVITDDNLRKWVWEYIQKDLICIK